MGIFTYEHQGANTVLVYSLDMDETIDTLAVGMIANNKIEGILSPGFVQNNTVRQLKYNISSKITLQRYFSGTVKKKQLIGVLRSLTETFLQAEKFLLGEESFLLDWEHIYVDAGSANAYLLCFPLENEDIKRLTYYELIHRVIYQIKFDESEDCIYIASLMNFINKKDNFTFRSFLEILKHIELESQWKENNQRIREPIPKAELYHGAENRIQTTASNLPEQVPNVLIEEEKKTGKKKNKKSRKEKKEKKEKRFSLPFGRKKKEEVPKPSFAIPGMPQVTPKDMGSDLSSKAGSTLKDVTPQNQVRVQKEPVKKDITPLHVTITRLRNGMSMDIRKEVFRIGKSENFADFCIPDNGTVSRSHADILLLSQGVYIRDNNSLNHTYVNEQMVPAGMQVMLSDGDCIRLSDEKFLVGIR